MSENPQKSFPHEQKIRITYARLYEEPQDLSSNVVQSLLSNNKKQTISIPVVLTTRTIDTTNNTQLSKQDKYSSQLNLFNDIQSPQYTSSLLKHKMYLADQKNKEGQDNQYNRHFSNINFDEDDGEQSDKQQNNKTEQESNPSNALLGKNYTIAGLNNFQPEQFPRPLHQKYASTQIEKQTITMNSDNTSNTKLSSQHKIKARAHTFDTKGNIINFDTKKLNNEQKMMQEIIQQQNITISDHKEKLRSVQKTIYESQRKYDKIQAKQDTQTLNIVAIFLAIVVYLVIKYIKRYKHK